MAGNPAWFTPDRGLLSSRHRAYLVTSGWAFPGTEATVYLCLLVGLSLLSFLSHRLRQSAVQLLSKNAIKGALPLLLILIIAFAVRSLHPLQSAALGQSDAYTHLHYLRHLAEHARIFNIVYPAGYHWLLALPVLVFGLDPYIVVRFAGAFGEPPWCWQSMFCLNGW